MEDHNDSLDILEFLEKHDNLFPWELWDKPVAAKLVCMSGNEVCRVPCEGLPDGHDYVAAVDFGKFGVVKRDGAKEHSVNGVPYYSVEDVAGRDGVHVAILDRKAVPVYDYVEMLLADATERGITIRQSEFMFADSGYFPEKMEYRALRKPDRSATDEWVRRWAASVVHCYSQGLALSSYGERYWEACRQDGHAEDPWSGEIVFHGGKLVRAGDRAKVMLYASMLESCMLAELGISRNYRKRGMREAGFRKTDAQCLRELYAVNGREVMDGYMKSIERLASKRAVSCVMCLREAALEHSARLQRADAVQEKLNTDAAARECVDRKTFGILQKRPVTAFGAARKSMLRAFGNVSLSVETLKADSADVERWKKAYEELADRYRKTKARLDEYESLRKAVQEDGLSVFASDVDVAYVGDGKPIEKVVGRHVRETGMRKQSDNKETAMEM